MINPVQIVQIVPGLGAFNVELDALAADLEQAPVITWDWETSGPNPFQAQPMGVGVFLPSLNRAYYINVWHLVHNPAIPRNDEGEVARVLNTFFQDAGKHAVGHNVLYDMLVNHRLGIRH